MTAYYELEIKKKKTREEKKRTIRAPAAAATSQKGIFGWFTEREHGEQGITPPKTGI